jgi:SAM-dependent methyltransferase
MTDLRCLEIGPGDCPIDPGWDTVDSKIARIGRGTDGYKQYPFGGWGYELIPAARGTYDLVYASHVLEHVPWYKTVNALKDVWRILKPGGTIEVWVPNFWYLVQCYQERICGDRWKKHNRRRDPMLWLNGRLFTYGPGDDNWHRACFDGGHLANCLQQAGFTDVARIPRRTRGRSHGKIDLGMTGRKP